MFGPCIFTLSKAIQTLLILDHCRGDDIKKDVMLRHVYYEGGQIGRPGTEVESL
jgi:hypothetical protein